MAAQVKLVISQWVMGFCIMHHLWEFGWILVLTLFLFIIHFVTVS